MMRRFLKVGILGAGLVGSVVLSALVLPYLVSGAACTTIAPTVPVSTEVAYGIPGSTRHEADTYLTFPEWYIVYSAEEYAQFIAQHPPQQFPFLTAIGQYWCSYKSMYAVVDKAGYAHEPGQRILLLTIGASFSFEYEIRWLYENTIGRITSALAGGEQTEEDLYGQRVEQTYADFLYETPWYAFPYGQKFTALWKEVPLWGKHPIRKWERRVALSFGYLSKGAYAWVIGKVTGAAYAPAELVIYMRTRPLPPGFHDERVEVVQVAHDGSLLLRVPRYGQFTDIMLKLAALKVQSIDIAGNAQIVLTVLAPQGAQVSFPNTTEIFSMPVAIERERRRVALSVPVLQLHEIIRKLQSEQVEIEHVYDY